MNKDTVVKLNNAHKNHKLNKAACHEAIGTGFDVELEYNKLKQLEPVFIDNKVSLSAMFEKAPEINIPVLFFYFFISHHSLHLAHKVKEPLRRKFGPFVPVLMMAMKDAHNIKYNDWDREDPKMKYALGVTLEALLTINQDVIWTPELAQKYGAVLKYSSNGLYTTFPESKEYESIWNFKLKAQDGFNSAVPCIPLQWWQARPAVRLPSRMILDVYDWDKVPESYNIETISIPINTPDMKYNLPF